jgi:hypothetical protein
MRNLNITLLLFLIIVSWCCQNQNTIKVDDNLCILIIAHHECTGCRDFVIDSGDIKMADTVLAKFKPFIDPHMRLEAGEIQDTFKKPNLSDFIVSDTALFNKLWGNVTQVNYWGDTVHFDFSKKYRVKGWVVDFDSVGNTFFKIKEYTLLDSIYAQRFD